MSSPFPTTKDFGIDYSFLVYILFAVLASLGTAYYAVKNDKTILAIAVVISSIAIFWFFGSRWFDGYKLKNDMTGGVDRSTTWPPQINYCPDFLSLKSVTSGTTTTYYCVDTMKIAKELKTFNEGDTITTSGSNINAIQIPTTYDATSLATLKTTLDSNQLKWEGVYNLMSFSGATIPNPNTVAT